MVCSSIRFCTKWHNEKGKDKKCRDQEIAGTEVEPRGFASLQSARSSFDSLAFDNRQLTSKI